MLKIDPVLVMACLVAAIVLGLVFLSRTNRRGGGDEPSEFEPVKIDDASWHADANSGGDDQRDQFSTHIGIFVRWAFANDGIAATQSDPLAIYEAQLVRDGKQPATAFVDRWWDGKLFEHWLNGDVREFTMLYYSASGDLNGTSYLDDYEAIVAGDLYRVPESDELYQKVAPILDQRFAEFLRTERRAVPLRLQGGRGE